MTTSLLVIANVKQLRTDGSFRILLSFFQTSWGVGVLNSAIFNSFHNRVEFGTIWEGLRSFGVGGGLNTPTPPSRYATAHTVCFCSAREKLLSRQNRINFNYYNYSIRLLIILNTGNIITLLYNYLR